MSLPRVKGRVSPKAEVNYPIRMKGTRNVCALFPNYPGMTECFLNVDRPPVRQATPALSAAGGWKGDGLVLPGPVSQPLWSPLRFLLFLSLPVARQPEYFSCKQTRLPFVPGQVHSSRR